MRFAGKGKGKSGGYRVITFFAGTDIPVFLLNIFAKNEKTDLTPRERRGFKNVLSDMVKTLSRPTGLQGNPDEKDQINRRRTND